MASLVLCYIASLFMLWEHPQHRLWLTRISIAVWTLAGASVAAWLFPESLTQLVFAAFCGLLLVGLGVEVMEFLRQTQPDKVDSKTLVESVVKVCKNEYENSDAPQKKNQALDVLDEEGKLSSVDREDKEQDVQKCKGQEIAATPVRILSCFIVPHINVRA